MATITTRAGKGSPLTNNEVDANFINLNADKYQAGDSPDFVDVLADKVSLDTSAAVAPGVGEIAWDDGNGAPVVGLKGGNVLLQLGQELIARVYNDSGVTLTDGQIVYISGAQGNRVAVKLAKADSETTSIGTIGMVTETIAAGAEGFITITGVVNGLNTIGLAQGAPIYLSPSVAGGYTTTKPVAPNHLVTIGWVERVHAIVGSIFVKIDNGYELDELHNISFASLADKQPLVYDAATGLWKNGTALGTAAYAATTDFDPAGTAVALAIALG